MARVHGTNTHETVSLRYAQVYSLTFGDEIPVTKCEKSLLKLVRHLKN